MQPSDQDPNDNWNQPQEVSSQAPYQHPQAPESIPEPVPETTAPPDTEPELAPTNNVAQPADESEMADDSVLIRWEAPEYAQHDRSMVWYGIFGIVTIAITAAAIWLIKSPSFAVLVPVMAVALFIYVRRPPEVMKYTLSRKGLHINDKLFPYTQFKSFGVLKGNGINSAVLVPRKRFQLGATIYFPVDVGEKLVDMLASRLPMKEVAPDAIDRLLARLHL